MKNSEGKVRKLKAWTNILHYDIFSIHAYRNLTLQFKSYSGNHAEPVTSFPISPSIFKLAS